MKNGAPLCAAYQQQCCMMDEKDCDASHRCAVVLRTGIGHVVDTMQQQPAMTSEQFCMWLQHHRRQISNRRSKLE